MTIIQKTSKAISINSLRRCPGLVFVTPQDRCTVSSSSRTRAEERPRVRRVVSGRWPYRVRRSCVDRSRFARNGQREASLLNAARDLLLTCSDALSAADRIWNWSMSLEEWHPRHRAWFECVDREDRFPRIRLGRVAERRDVRWLPCSTDPTRLESLARPCRSPRRYWWLCPSVARREAAVPVRSRLGIAGKQKLTRRARPRACSIAQKGLFFDRSKQEEVLLSIESKNRRIRDRKRDVCSECAADLQVQREICCVIVVQWHAKGIERLEKYAGMANRERERASRGIVDQSEEMQFVGLSPTTRLIFTRTSFNLVNIRKENRNPMEIVF